MNADIEKTFSVYVHTNQVNGKKYVGITSMNPEERWGNNGRCYSKQPFYRAIKKYGWDSFDHKILYTDLSSEEANVKEIELIKSMNTLFPNGYNSDGGGGGTGGRRKWTDEMKQKASAYLKKRFQNPETKQKMKESCKKRWENEEQRKDISEKRKAYLSNSENMARTREIMYDNPNWKSHFIGGNNPFSRKVALVNDGSVYACMMDAANKFNIKSRGISESCLGKHSYCGIDARTGFPLVWLYYEEYLCLSEQDRLERLEKAKKNFQNPSAGIAIPVRCITTGEEFQSARSAMDKYGASKTNIIKCCSGKQKYCGKHPKTGEKLVWEYIS